MDAYDKTVAGLMLSSPFFGSLACRLKGIADPSVPTGYTDGKVIGYNPVWFEGLSSDERRAFLAHEIWHVAALHPWRKKERDHKGWNMAADFEGNLILKDSGFSIPQGGLIDEKYRGMEAEAIYASFPPPEGEGDGKPGPEGYGEVRDAPGDPSQQQDGEAQAKAMVSQAMTQAKAMGQLPGEVERLLRKLLRHKVDWREVMREFVQRSHVSRQSWKNPNRRLRGLGLTLPGAEKESFEVIVGVDTSGSISDEVLERFQAEVKEILSLPNAKVHVLHCDAEIQAAETVEDPDDLSIRAIGGGGTDFRPVFEWAEKEEHNAACIIYLTDMQGCFPDREPDIPVLWVKTTEIPAPWGLEVEI